MRSPLQHSLQYSCFTTNTNNNKKTSLIVTVYSTVAFHAPHHVDVHNPVPLDTRFSCIYHYIIAYKP